MNEEFTVKRIERILFSLRAERFALCVFLRE